MIKQIYTAQNELFIITIKGKKVTYKDRKLPQEVQIIPKDPRINKLILTSRNRIDKKFINAFELTKEEQGEYDSAVKSGQNIEESLARICKKDCLKNGYRLQKEEHG